MTMGTTYTVKLAPKSSYKREHVKRQISEILNKVNQKMSTYMEDSDISVLNNLESDKIFVLDPWFNDVLRFSIDLARRTDGAYDPTVGPLVNLWGFGPAERKSLPSEKDISQIKESVGYEKLMFVNFEGKPAVKKTKSKLYVDLSSSAKGYAVDKLSEFLMSEGLDDFLIEVGGEMKARGKKFKADWVVAIEKPDPGQRSVYRSFPLKNMSIATSGSYRNFFKSGDKTYSHTIDASTGRPIEHKMVSVTVLDESCMKADAHATALMVLGPERAKSFSEKEGLAVYFIYKKDTEIAEFNTYSSKAFKALNPMLN